MLPSFYLSDDRAQPWRVTCAAACGAVIGGLAALVKTFAPLHDTIAVGGRPAWSFLASVPEIAGAALGFALLCAAAAALRNFIAQRLIWPETR
jgi:hypothetical protein